MELVFEMKYIEAEKRIKALLEENLHDSLQNIVDYLYESFEKYSWLGVYFVKGNHMFLGPWKGKQATENVKIPIGVGVCGSAAKTGKTEIVQDVKNDMRYLSCFISTRSEIVVPIMKNNVIIAEIDIDSDQINAFNEKDKKLLENIANNKSFVNLIMKNIR